MALVKFERNLYPMSSVQFSRNPSRGGYSRKLSYLQPKDMTDGGKLYVYDKGISPKKERILNWRNMPKTDYDNFMSFLEAIKGAKYNFTFTDIDGSAYTARIMNGDNIQSQPVAEGRESLTVELWIEA